MRLAPVLTLFCLLSASALAADPAPKEGAPGTNVEMPYLMAPMTGSDGTLSGYAYISSRLTASSPAVALEVRDKIAFIQDAFVRDVNKASIAKDGAPGDVDKAGLETRLLSDAEHVMGPDKVAAIRIVQLQIAPLHPNAVTPSTTLVSDSAAASAR